MSSSRHRAAAPPLRARLRRLAIPTALATCVTGGAVALGVTVAAGQSPSFDLTAADATRAAQQLIEGSGQSSGAAAESLVAERTFSASRTERRVRLEPQAVAKRWATADLNIWSRPTDKSTLLGLVESGDRVPVTGQVIDGWAEVILKGKVRYVNAKYLSDEQPDDVAVVGGIVAAPCPDGSGTEAGLTQNAIRMFRAVCNAFPALSVYGGYDNHGEHADGRAVDFMTYENRALGYAIAEWARAHAAELNIRTIIFAQRIWTRERAAEGWRPMSNRGSVTANHYDHPHISVY